MMRCAIAFLALTAAVLVAPGRVSASPPSRPLQLTETQFDRLCQLEMQAEHVAVLDVRASYTSEREARLEANRLTDDITTGAYQFGFAGALLFVVLTGL